MRRAAPGRFLTLILASAVAGILVLGGCSSGRSSRATSATTAAAAGTATSSFGSSSSSPTTSPARATTTTLGSPPPPGTVPFTRSAHEPSDGVSPAGSGCTPRSLTALPDGEWFGILTSVDPAGQRIGLDLECLYWGDAANAAAKADGSTDLPVPNDHYQRNRSPLVYRQPTVPDVAVGVLGAGGSATAYYPTAHGIAAARALIGRDVWIQVTQGWVTAIQQQYFP